MYFKSPWYFSIHQLRCALRIILKLICHLNNTFQITVWKRQRIQFIEIIMQNELKTRVSWYRGIVVSWWFRDGRVTYWKCVASSHEWLVSNSLQEVTQSHLGRAGKKWNDRWYHELHDFRLDVEQEITQLWKRSISTYFIPYSVSYRDLPLIPYPTRQRKRHTEHDYTGICISCIFGCFLPLFEPYLCTR